MAHPMSRKSWLLKIGASASYVREAETHLRLAAGSEPPAEHPETGAQLFLLDVKSTSLSSGWVAASGCTAVTVILGQGREDRRGPLNLGPKRERQKLSGLFPLLGADDIATWAQLPPLLSLEDYQADILVELLVNSAQAQKEAKLAAKDPRRRRAAPPAATAQATWPWSDPDLALGADPDSAGDSVIDTEVSVGQSHTAASASAAGGASAPSLSSARLASRPAPSALGKRPMPPPPPVFSSNFLKRPAAPRAPAVPASRGRGRGGRAGRGRAGRAPTDRRPAYPSRPASPTRRLPVNWPQDVVFTPYLLYAGGTISSAHPAAPIWPALQQAWRLLLANARQAPISGVEIRPLPDDGPLWQGQSGLYATEEIPEGKLVGDYTGVVREAGIGEVNESGYVASMEVPQPDGLPPLHLDVDAQHYGNELRFVNHFSCLSDTPNLDLRPRQCDLTGEMCLGAYAVRRVAAGEQLLLDYGQCYWEAQEAFVLAIPVTVRTMDGTTLGLEIFLDQTVAEVAAVVEERLAGRGGIPPGGAGRLKMILAGRRLDDDSRRVAEYGVQKNSELHVLFAGGGAGGSVVKAEQ